MKNTFVIGDVHGHYDRLIALLTKANIIDEKGRTELGQKTEVVQVGDLVNLTNDTRQNDLRTAKYAPDYLDVILWGNHDFAWFDENLTFRGYARPAPELAHYLKKIKYKFIHQSHGFTITHAGIHPLYKGWAKGDIQSPHDGMGVIYDIGYRRGGINQQGGILWRDAFEQLADIPQIFGHTRGDVVRWYGKDKVCIDIGGISDGRLAGIWLPSMEVVEL